MLTKKIVYISLGLLSVAILIATGILIFSKPVTTQESSKHNETKNSEIIERVSSSSSSESLAALTDDSFELKNLGTDMSNLIVDNNVLREYKSNGIKGFYTFGEKLPGKDILNPNFEFASLRSSTKVISPIDGVIGFIRPQEDTKDYEVFIQTFEGSIWTISLDHLVKLEVKKGDKVSVGDLIGYPNIQGNGTYRFEIQINKDKDGKTSYYCPTFLLESNAREIIGKKITDMEKSWESLSKLDLYSIEKEKYPGCLFESFSDQ
jgi:hypothetical protein